MVVLNVSQNNNKSHEYWGIIGQGEKGTDGDKGKIRETRGNQNILNTCIN